MEISAPDRKIYEMLVYKYGAKPHLDVGALQADIQKHLKITPNSFLHNLLEDLNDSRVVWMWQRPDVLAHFLSLIPTTFKKRINDKLVFNRIQEKDWPKFRPETWIKEHTKVMASTASFKVLEKEFIPAQMKYEIAMEMPNTHSDLTPAELHDLLEDEIAGFVMHFERMLRTITKLDISANDAALRVAPDKVSLEMVVVVMSSISEAEVNKTQEIEKLATEDFSKLVQSAADKPKSTSTASKSKESVWWSLYSDSDVGKRPMRGRLPSLEADFLVDFSPNKADPSKLDATVTIQMEEEEGVVTGKAELTGLASIEDFKALMKKDLNQILSKAFA